jgi:hypothetical protein
MEEHASVLLMLVLKIPRTAPTTIVISASTSTRSPTFRSPAKIWDRITASPNTPVLLSTLDSSVVAVVGAIV